MTPSPAHVLFVKTQTDTDPIHLRSDASGPAEVAKIIAMKQRRHMIPELTIHDIWVTG